MVRQHIGAYMRSLLSLLCLSFVSMAHAESVYTCTEARGDSVIIEMSRQGENMLLRSLYRKLNFRQSKNHRGNSDYFTYNSSHGALSLQESVVRGDSGSDVVGDMLMEGHTFHCRVGEGKLVVSRQTRREFSGGGGGRGGCRITTYWQGITFIPPRVICNYGGFTTLTSINRGLPF